MRIKQIELTDFRNFKDYHKFEFDKINLISGQIGIGKSSLGRLAITFALYGEADVNLLSLVNKYSNKTWVAILLEDKKDRIYIKRSVPSKLLIKLNDKEILEGATNTEKENWIKNRFGDATHFKKFRMIDLRQGVNLLDEGKTTLRKTLLSIHEDIFNAVRQKLLEKKNTVEKYNLDSVVVYKHFPSMKRLNTLNASLQELIKSQTEYDAEIRRLENIKYTCSNKVSEVRTRGKDCASKLQHLQTKSFCPMCRQEMLVEKRDSLIADLQKQLEKINAELLELTANERVATAESNKLKIENKEQLDYKQHLNELIFRLTTRIKQKDFKFTNKDVLIISNAIKELDKFFAFYLVSCIKNLEPIINEIIDKIGFEIYFNINNKGDFGLYIVKDGKEYDYKDLSSGQRLMITIAFQIALLMDKGEDGLIIADEGFSNFDEETLKLVYNFFNEFPFQLISIIHRYDNPDEFINIINLNKYFGDNNVAIQ